MKKIILMTVMMILLCNTTYASKKWSDEDLYLFTAVVSSQIADYTQSLKFDTAYATRNDCGFLDTPQPYVTESGAIGIKWYGCTERRYRRVEEANPIVRRDDGGFDGDRAIILATALDVSLFYVGTKFPKWRRPLLYVVYIAEMFAIQKNHNWGFKPDFPVLPVIITYNF